MKTVQMVPPLIFSLLISACRTLNPGAQSVVVLDRPPTTCKKLGLVNVDWTGWGSTTECLNVMKNQTSDLGGNALLLHGDAVGTAYRCERVD